MSSATSDAVLAHNGTEDDVGEFVRELFDQESVWEATLRYHADQARRAAAPIGFNRHQGMLSYEARAKGGRQAAIASSPFTDDQVRAIRASQEPLKILAQRYGTSMATVSRIRSRKRRSEVPDV